MESRVARLRVEKVEFSRQRIGWIAAVPPGVAMCFGSATDAALGRLVLPGQSDMA
jgi:hypothetical protein